MTTPYESGKRFETEIIRSIEKLKDKYGASIYHWRILDPVAFGADTKYHTVPCDHMVVFEGSSYFIEDKSSWNEKYYPLRYIRENQLNHLSALSAAGGEALFALAKRNKDNITEQAWIVPLKEVVAYMKYGEGKFYWGVMSEIGIELKKIAGRKIFTYDLSEVIK